MARSEIGRTGARFGAPARRAQHTEDPESAHGQALPDDGAPATEPPAAQRPVGLTGARFGGQSRPKRTRRQRGAEATADAGEPAATAAAVTDQDGRTGATAPLPRVTGAHPAPGRGGPPGPAEEFGAPAPVTVRPYVLTGGRTRAPMELRIETLVSTIPGAGAGAGGYVGERGSVLELCHRPRSVSEVAALTRVPLGVARVLIGDLATEGWLRVHAGADGVTGPDLALLDRVLSGLRNL